MRHGARALDGADPRRDGDRRSRDDRGPGEARRRGRADGAGQHQPGQRAHPALGDSRECVESRASLPCAQPAQASTNATLYNAALAEFERAYQLLEGNPRRYLELKNIGDCHLGLGQTDAALDAYRRYLREGGASAENREDIEQRIRQLCEGTAAAQAPLSCAATDGFAAVA